MKVVKGYQLTQRSLDLLFKKYKLEDLANDLDISNLYCMYDSYHPFNDHLILDLKVIEEIYQKYLGGKFCEDQITKVIEESEYSYLIELGDEHKRKKVIKKCFEYLIEKNFII